MTVDDDAWMDTRTDARHVDRERLRYCLFIVLVAGADSVPSSGITVRWRLDAKWRPTNARGDGTVVFGRIIVVRITAQVTVRTSQERAKRALVEAGFERVMQAYKREVRARHQRPTIFLSYTKMGWLLMRASWLALSLMRWRMVVLNPAVANGAACRADHHLLWMDPAGSGG